MRTKGVTVDWMLVVLVGAAAIVAVAWLVRERAASHTGGPIASAPVSSPTGMAELRPAGVSELVARLSVSVEDPERRAVQRLARELAEQGFAASGRVDRVVIQDRDGRHIATVPRRERPLRPAPMTPDHVRADGGPGAPHARGRTELAVAPRLADDPAAPARTWLDRLELPEVVRADVRHPDDAVDVVRAILAAGGHQARVIDNLLHIGDTAVVVLKDVHGTAAALGNAFLRFQRSGARFGIVVHTGWVDPTELRRRDALVPQLAYVGPGAIQRMADAVELGLDPLAAARGMTVPSR